jgi:hypothetical protein
MVTRFEDSTPFWSPERQRRLHPRLAAEMFVDAQNLQDEPRALIQYLKERDFSPDYLRAKGYVSSNDQIVGILPFLSSSLLEVASVGIRRPVNVSFSTVVLARGTIVTMDGGTTAREFTLLTPQKGDVAAEGPISLERLRASGAAGIFQEFAESEKGWNRVAMTRMSSARVIATMALEDLATDEVRLGFISDSEFHQIMADAGLYAELARLHTYLMLAQGQEAAGCSGCSSSTCCYACTTSSCDIF